jgi:hypothetical protein
MVYHRHPPVLARVEHWNDVGVIEPSRDLDLAKEPLGAKGGGDGGLHHLEGDAAIMLEVVGEVTAAIPPRPSSRSSV